MTIQTMFIHTSSPPQLSDDSAHLHPEVYHNPHTQIVSLFAELTMDPHEFEDFCDSFNLPDIPDFNQFDDNPNMLNWDFTVGESSTLNPNELEKTQKRFSADGAEGEVDSFANPDEGFPPTNNGTQATPCKSSNQLRQGTPYTYDKFGQLEGNTGYEKEVIEHYLCKHHFYGQRTELKNCGLTLWIQRAPLSTESYGVTSALCLYNDCHVNPTRLIQAGDIRIAFDENAARGLKRDPRINAGYVHLKCLEAHIPDHRQLFAKLNFKVEGRGPQKKDSWLLNPTIFTTINQIIYAEEYIEGCSKESWNGGSTSNAILLSAIIEKELRGVHPVALEVQSRLLEMEGWGDMKALLALKYTQAYSNTQLTTIKKIESRPLQPKPKPKAAVRTTIREAYTKKKTDHRGRDGKKSAKKVEKRAGRRNRYDESPPEIKDSRLKKSSDNSKRAPKKRDLSPYQETELEDEVATTSEPPQPLKKGEGKIKSRMFLDKDGKEVWEDYEDPWSPLISDMEDGTTEDNDEWSGDEDSGDEDSGDDEPRGRKRMRSDDEDYSAEDDETSNGKRKRVY